MSNSCIRSNNHTIRLVAVLLEENGMITRVGRRGSDTAPQALRNEYRCGRRERRAPAMAGPQPARYRATGRMTEKYDVVDITREAGGGEYPNQDGFEWTNGIALKPSVQRSCKRSVYSLRRRARRSHHFWSAFAAFSVARAAPRVCTSE